MANHSLIRTVDPRRVNVRIRRTLCQQKMNEEIIKAIDEIVAFLRRCQKSEDWIDRFTALRQRLESAPDDSTAIEELRVLGGPRGFLGDCPHYPKPDSGLTRRQVEEESDRLVELTWNAIEKWKAQPGGGHVR